MPPRLRVWTVGVLLRAVADALEARFNPVAVEGEISGFSRAASGHCYFTLKDEQGQVRCAMFRRAAMLLDFQPKDGQHVELRGRIGVYEPRGELQLVVESLKRAGEGSLFEKFIQLKAKLEALGLFEVERKRALPRMPKSVGIVTSLGAAALHDVGTALQRRAPHVRVVIYPASVQGAQAPAELVASLRRANERQEVDVLLLVRGGGAMEDLWAFNDEQLARAIVASTIPVVVGVGHETDFTIADFCADLRAPTPTAAAEICAQPQTYWLADLAALEDRLQRGTSRLLNLHSQMLDRAAARVGRPSHAVTLAHASLVSKEQRLRHSIGKALLSQGHALAAQHRRLPDSMKSRLAHEQRRLERAQTRLELLDPSLVLQRGYAWLTDLQGHALTSVAQTHTGQAIRATLADGEVDLTVEPARLI